MKKNDLIVEAEAEVEVILEKLEEDIDMSVERVNVRQHLDNSDKTKPIVVKTVRIQAVDQVEPSRWADGKTEV